MTEERQNESEQLNPEQLEIRKEIDELISSEDFRNNSLRISQNPADRQKHAELMNKRDELYKKLYSPTAGQQDGQEHSASTPKAAGGGPAKSVQTQIDELKATPGFLDGKLKTSLNEKDRKLHQQLMDKWQDLIGKQIAAETPASTESSAITKPGVKQQTDSAYLPDAVLQQAHADFDKLKELGFEGALPDAIEPWHTEAWRLQRLNAESDFQAIGPLLQKAVNPAAAPVLHAFLSEGTIGKELKQNIIDLVIADIYKEHQE